ncbi:DMT family transporter [Candidatus Micrarchaeota archaeon]|nr:DMT family transporter [Candidatus Micrarchaeota archaeon]
MPWLLLTIASAFLKTITEIMRKRLLLKRVNAFSVALLTGGIASVLLPLVFWSQADFTFSEKTFQLLIVQAILNCITFYIILEGFRRWDASRASPMANFSPLFAALLGFLVLGEMLSITQFAGIGLIVIGSLFLEGHGIHWRKWLSKREDRQTFLMIIGGAALWSVHMLIAKIVLQEINVYTNAIVFTWLYTGFYIAWLAVRKPLQGNVFQSLRKHHKQFVILVIFDYAHYLLLLAALAIPGAMLSLIAPIHRINSIFTVLIGGKLLKEKYVLKRALATVIMIAGVWFIAS